MTFAESHLFRTDLRTRRELCAGTEGGRSCPQQRKSVSWRRGRWGAGDGSLRAGVWPLFAALYSIPRARGALASLILVLVQGSSWAQTAPQLVSVSPPDGATLVPTTAALVFVFDQDMDTTLPPFQSIPNVIAGNFEVLATGFNQTLLATWGADKRTLTIRAAIQFPYATFTWRLNPPGGLFSFKSAAGVLLATVSGTFATGVGGATPVLASSSPANHAMGVALDVQVTFNFDQIMKTNTAIGGMPPAVPAAVRWTGTGLDVAKFTYSWSANGR